MQYLSKLAYHFSESPSLFFTDTSQILFKNVNHLLFVARKVKYRDRNYLLRSLLALEVRNKELSSYEKSRREVREGGRGICSASVELEN